MVRANRSGSPDRQISTIGSPGTSPALLPSANLALEIAITVLLSTGTTTWDEDAALLSRAATVADFCWANAVTVDHDGALPVEEFRHLTEAGLLAAPLGTKLGGLGLGLEAGRTHTLLLLLAQLGRGSLSVGRIYEGHLNALLLVQRYGTRRQARSAALEVREGRRLFGVWNTETEDGVQLTPLPVREGSPRFRISGAKTFASGAGLVQRPLVTGALPDGGWQMFVVPFDRVAATIDHSWWRPLGMRASASGKVDFTGVELEACALIGSPGDYAREPWFAGGAIRFAAVQLGGATALFEATCDYLRELDRAADPYQQARIGQMAVAIESGYLWLRGAADVNDSYLSAAAQDGPTTQATADLVLYANMTRTAIERLCLDLLELAERSVGARGLLQPRPFERLIRDLRLYLRQPAPDAALASIGQRALAQPGRKSHVHG